MSHTFLSCLIHYLMGGTYTRGDREISEKRDMYLIERRKGYIKNDMFAIFLYNKKFQRL